MHLYMILLFSEAGGGGNPRVPPPMKPWKVWYMWVWWNNERSYVLNTAYVLILWAVDWRCDYRSNLNPAFHFTNTSFPCVFIGFSVLLYFSQYMAWGLAADTCTWCITPAPVCMVCVHTCPYVESSYQGKHAHSQLGKVWHAIPLLTRKQLGIQGMPTRAG